MVTATNVCPWKLRDGLSEAGYGWGFLAEWSLFAMALVGGSIYGNV